MNNLRKSLQVKFQETQSEDSQHILCTEFTYPQFFIVTFPPFFGKNEELKEKEIHFWNFIPPFVSLRELPCFASSVSSRGTITFSDFRHCTATT